jgi:hypothetical protein
LAREIDSDDIRDGRSGVVTKVSVRHGKLHEEFKPHECAFLTPFHGYAESSVYSTAPSLNLATRTIAHGM